MTLTIPNLSRNVRFSIVEPADGVEVISQIVDPDAKRHYISMYAYENDFGGRVVVQAFDLESAYGVAFNHTFRAEQLQSVMRWLGRGQAPVLVRGGVSPLAFRKDCGNQTLLGFFNLTLDPWPFVEFELKDQRWVEEVKLLSPSGVWKKDHILLVKKVRDLIIIRHEKSAPNNAPLFISIRWKEK